VNWNFSNRAFADNEGEVTAAPGSFAVREGAIAQILIPRMEGGH
jgi:hypothetical protein